MKELLDATEPAAADKLSELVETVDKELKCAQRLHVKLSACGYSMPAIVLMQDSVHEKYRKKTGRIDMGEC